MLYIQPSNYYGKRRTVSVQAAIGIRLDNYPAEAEEFLAKLYALLLEKGIVTVEEFKTLFPTDWIITENEGELK